MMPRKDERNRALCADYLDGVDARKLSDKYRVSVARVYEILREYGVKKRGPMAKPRAYQKVKAPTNEDMITTCTTCELDDCILHSVECPFNQKFGYNAKPNTLNQQSCGKRQRFDV